MPIKDIAIFGAGGFGLEVAMLTEQINAASPSWNMIGFFDDGMSVGNRINDYQLQGGVDALNAWPEPLGVAFALGIPQTRQAVVKKLNNGNRYPTLIHPSVIMGASRYVEIGEGGIICAGTIITTNIHIGRFVILNLACTVGHGDRDRRFLLIHADLQYLGGCQNRQCVLLGHRCKNNQPLFGRRRYNNWRRCRGGLRHP